MNKRVFTGTAQTRAGIGTSIERPMEQMTSAEASAVPEQTTPAVPESEQTTPVVPESEQAIPAPEQLADDYAWIDELTVVETEHGTQDDVEQATPAPTETVVPPTEAWEGLQHIDAEVAAELNERLVQPRMTALEQEIAALKAAQQRQQQSNSEALRAKTNDTILAAVPKADKILASVEFAEFMDKGKDPYAADTPMQKLSRAYHAGDAEYVVAHLEKFIQTRRKPRPTVGAEPVQGTATQHTEANPARPMTMAEFNRRKQEIMQTPRHKRSATALKDLAEEFEKSQQRK